MLKHKSYTKNGFTLVEVILAMAILAIIVVMLAPAIVSAFRMVTLSGDRQKTGKRVVADMENVIGGEPITASLGDVSIVLPGNISVAGSKFLLEQDSKNGKVDLFGYYVKPMPLQEPTGTTPAATPIPTPSPEPTLTPTPEPTLPAGVTPTPTPEPTPSPSPSPSPIPSEPAFDMTKTIVDVSGWYTTFRYGFIQIPDYLASSISKIEFQVVKDKSNIVIQDWQPIESINKKVYFADNFQNYTVILRQTTNLTNTFPIYVRSAPRVFYYFLKSNKVAFKINLNSQYYPILSNHYVQQYIGSSHSWITIPTGYEANDNQIDEANVFVRFDASLDADGVTKVDPPSFPAKVIGQVP